MTIDYGSVCSGIESVSVAVHPLGWTPAWFAEIEPFPSAVLAHRFPGVPNHGDMTLLPAKVLRGEIPAPAILVGGTPCQAFSVAGMRQGLIDPRGALTIKFVELADAIDHARSARDDAECVVWWENVPGVLSDKGNAFGCFLAALVGESDPLEPSGARWTDAGCVYGPQRTAAWRVLDAQYFGLAQRRRRVFVVASARRGFDPAAVLFESEGLRRDTPPRRGEGQDVAGSITASLGRRGGTPDCGSTPGQLQPVTCMAHGQRGAEIAEGRSPTLTCNHEAPIVVHGTQDPCVQKDQAHTLGRNSGQENAVLAFAENSRSEVRIEAGDGQIVGTLSTGGGKPGQGTPCIAFSCKDHGADAGELAPTLRAMGHGESHANAGGQVAVCVTGEITHTLKAEGFDASEDGTGRGQPIITHAIQAGALRTNPASGPDGVGVQADHAYTLEARAEVQAIQSASAVRRLTPRETERLQGFPDDWTQIPWRGKPASECPDGPRYKAVGNSKATYVVRWIAQRIQDHIGENP